MKRKIIKNRISKVVASLLMSVAIIAGMTQLINIKAQASEGNYISSILLKAGKDGNATLSKKGYNVLSPSLVDGNGKKIWLGYKTTDDAKKAIRGMVVANSKGNVHASLDGDRVLCKPVKGGSIMLDGDKEAFLHITRSEKAGAPIKAITLLNSNTNNEVKFSSVMAVSNNGAETVRNLSKQPVVLKNNNGQTFLSLIKSDIWKNYVSSIAVFKGKNKRTVVKKIAEAGYDFYVDHNYGTKSKVKMMAIARTNDKNKAITDIIALSSKKNVANYNIASTTKIAGKYIFTTTNTKLGNPINNIDSVSGLSDIEISADEWAGVIVASGSNDIARPFITQNSRYISLTSSKTRYVLRNATCDDQTDLKISITTAKKNLNKKVIYKNKLLSKFFKPEVVASDNEESNKQGTANLARPDKADKPANNDSNVEEKNDSEEISQAVTENEKTTEVVEDNKNGEGTIITYIDDEQPPIVQLIILLAIALMIPIVTMVIRKRLKNK